MKKFVMVLLLCFSASGQTVYSGRGLSSGLSSRTGKTQGGLTFAARTDSCVIGYAAGDHTNCVNGATPGQSGSALSFLGQSGDPMPWFQTPGTVDPVNTAITDPDFGAYEVMVTSGTWGNSIGFGGTNPNQTFNESAGEFDPFSQDDTFLLVFNNQGGTALVELNLPLIRAKGCSPTSVCVWWTGIRSLRASESDACAPDNLASSGCTQMNSNAEFTFSRTPGESNVIYELMMTGPGAQVQVNKLTLTCTGSWSATAGPSCTFARAPYVNFSSNSPTSCSVLPAGFTSNSPWVGAFTVANDGTIGYVLGGAGDWQPNTPYAKNLQIDAFVYPLSNNSAHSSFQATTPGTSGGNEPNWGTTCNAVGSTCTDGTITWTNIGKIGGQGPGFHLVYYSPSLGCRRYNTLTGYVLNGTGYSGSATSGQMQTDSVSGLFNSCLNQYDSCTGSNCGPPGGYSAWAAANPAQLSGCQITARTVGLLTDQGTIHDGTIKVNPRYFGWSATASAFFPRTSSCRNSGNNYYEENCNNYVWDVTTNLMRPEQTWTNWNGTAVNGQSDSHEINGYVGNWKGGFSQIHNYAEPNFPNVADYGTAPTCYSASTMPAGTPCQIGSANAGVPLFTTNQATGITGGPWDHHGANRVADPADASPVLLFNTAVPALGRMGPGSGYPGASGCTGSNCISGYNEIIAMAPQAVAGCTSAVATYCQYRFAHNWGTGSVPQFNGQNEQGMNSQDGRFAAFATDVMGTRGSVSPDWSSGTYDYGDIINPICMSGCTNVLHSSFQQFNPSGCTTGSAQPSTWTSTPGSIVADGSGSTACSWKNVSQAATGSTGQLSCNGLRADLLQATGSTIYLGTRMFDLSSSNIYQATGCAASTTCSAANGGAGLTTTQSVSEGTANLGNSPAFLSTVTDSNGIIWQYIGQNDCRSDVVLVDLTSAQPH